MRTGNRSAGPSHRPRTGTPESQQSKQPRLAHSYPREVRPHNCVHLLQQGESTGRAARIDIRTSRTREFLVAEDLMNRQAVHELALPEAFVVLARSIETPMSSAEQRERRLAALVDVARDIDPSSLRQCLAQLVQTAGRDLRPMIVTVLPALARSIDPAEVCRAVWAFAERLAEHHGEEGRTLAEDLPMDLAVAAVISWNQTRDEIPGSPTNWQLTLESDRAEVIAALDSVCRFPHERDVRVRGGHAFSILDRAKAALEAGQRPHDLSLV